MAEERFLAQLCAFPSCEKRIQKEKKGEQLYKIDRVEGKVGIILILNGIMDFRYTRKVILFGMDSVVRNAGIDSKL